MPEEKTALPEILLVWVLFSVAFGAEEPTPLMYLGFGVIFLAMVCSETQFKFLRRPART